VSSFLTAHQRVKGYFVPSRLEEEQEQEKEDLLLAEQFACDVCITVLMEVSVCDHLLDHGM